MSRKVATVLLSLGWLVLPAWQTALGQEQPPLPPPGLFDTPAPPAVEDATPPAFEESTGPQSLQPGALPESDPTEIGSPAPIPEAATRDAREGDLGPDSDIPTEVIRERYPNRKIKIERHVTQDAQRNYVNHGPWTMWSPDGTIVGQGRFEWGKKQGNWSRLYIDVKDEKRIADKLTSHFSAPFTGVAEYVDGRLHGTWKIVDAQQRPVKDWELHHGRLHGQAVSWYPNGRKMNETTFDNGMMTGEMREWDSAGNLINKVTYKDGRSTTPYVKKFASGEKQFEGQYLGARQVFKTTIDFWNGFVEIKLIKKEGEPKRQGNWIEWYPSGGKKFEGAFLENRPMGRHTWWFTNGQKKSEGFFKNGKEDGLWIWWHENGLKQLEGRFVDGVESGTWTRWQPNGRVAETQQHTLQGGSPNPATVDTRHRSMRRSSPRMEHPPAPGVRRPSFPGTQRSSRSFAPLRRN